jgi:hypothetical protein
MIKIILSVLLISISTSINTQYANNPYKLDYFFTSDTISFLKINQKDGFNIITWSNTMDHNCLKFELYRYDELIFECFCDNEIDNYEFKDSAQNGIYELFQIDVDKLFHNRGVLYIFDKKCESRLDLEIIPLGEYPLGDLYLINGEKVFIPNCLD